MRPLKPINFDDVQIEKNVPIPPKGGNRHNRGYMRLLREMEIGDSFWLDKQCVGKAFPNVCAARAREIERTVSIRTSTENDIEGWRVWRVK